jgi:hypothetical protein
MEGNPLDECLESYTFLFAIILVVEFCDLGPI